MKIIQFLFDKIVLPVIVAFLTPIIISITSKMKTGNWADGFKSIPTIFWIWFGVALVVWIIIIAIRIRVKHIRILNADSPFFMQIVPAFGWIPIFEIKYSNVIWKILAPAPVPWRNFEPLNVSPSNLEIDIPPRCPKCKTELEESARFLGGYIWKCVVCNFQKKSKDSFYREEKRVEKIARHEWEKFLQEKK